MSRMVDIGKNDIDSYKSGNALLEICMEKVDYEKALRLDNIHYDTGKSDIRPDARPELDRLVQFLNDNPEVRVELSSHTDSRSSADYNLKLSQQRADEAKKYIVSKGIDANRVVSVGYGESRLLNRCADGVECSEEEHQLNRRTEIKMIK
jgi:outer membrane protein OmpA-like peptidoglycan-associated protein